MKVIAVTNLFPDKSRPTFASFNRQQFIHLAQSHDLHVISPVPWPHRLKLALSGTSPVPPDDCRQGMQVYYPTYFYTPKVLRGLYWRFYLAAILGTFRRLVNLGKPDIVYATWAYPDCYAAVLASERFGIPIVSRLHGSDVNEYFRHPPRKRLILKALGRSDSIISVSGDLKAKLVAEGLDEGRINVIYNGIDRDIFRPADRRAARRGLGLKENAKIILFAGNLKPVKGVGLLIEAAAGLGNPDLEVHIIGGGPEYSRLLGLTRRAGMEEKVFYHGDIKHALMAGWYNAADLFCLPSMDEGTPNVILEALACGTPVVATDTGGIPEILSGESGILFRRGDVADLTRALDQGLTRAWDGEKITCPAGSWGENAREVGRLFTDTVESFRKREKVE